MRVYIDSSVLLRVVLGEPGRLAQWSRIQSAFTSEIARVECLRTIERFRRTGSLPDREIARRRATLLEILGGFQTVRLNRTVLDRAAEPFPTDLRTLDALHLASAVLVRERVRALRFATHDEELGNAAIALGFAVLGLP